MAPEVAEWFDIAETDLKVARHLLDTFYPIPVEIVCYHCQQCAEKATKAVIMSLGAPGGLPKLHDISFLLDQIKNQVDIDEKYYEYADILAPYGIAVRYPNDLGLEEHHARSAVRYAEEYFQWAKSVIQ